MTEHEHVDLIEARLKEYRHIIVHGEPPASMVERREKIGADAKPAPRTLAQVQAEHPKPDSAIVADAMEADGTPRTAKVRKHPRARSPKDLRRNAFRRPRTT